MPRGRRMITKVNSLAITKNDTVVAISGDDGVGGKRGRVIAVFPKRQRVVVEGFNIVQRHLRPTQSNPQGGIVKKEASLHISQVMLVCPKCERGTRVGHKFLADGTKVRICKHCGEVIPRKGE